MFGWLNLSNAFSVCSLVRTSAVGGRQETRLDRVSLDWILGADRGGGGKEKEKPYDH